MPKGYHQEDRKIDQSHIHQLQGNHQEWTFNIVGLGGFKSVVNSIRMPVKAVLKNEHLTVLLLCILGSIVRTDGVEVKEVSECFVTGCSWVIAGQHVVNVC